jgi:hypothetical protein
MDVHTFRFPVAKKEKLRETLHDALFMVSQIGSP